jgi:hypothetical protein
MIAGLGATTSSNEGINGTELTFPCPPKLESLLSHLALPCSPFLSSRCSDRLGFARFSTSMNV